MDAGRSELPLWSPRPLLPSRAFFHAAVRAGRRKFLRPRRARAKVGPEFDLQRRQGQPEALGSGFDAGAPSARLQLVQPPALGRPRIAAMTLPGVMVQQKPHSKYKHRLIGHCPSRIITSGRTRPQ